MGISNCHQCVFLIVVKRRRKFTAARQWCQEQGWQFRIVTEQEIRGGYRLQNIQLLTHYARQKIDQAVCSQILSTIRQSGMGLLMKELLQKLSTPVPDLLQGQILHLAYHHQIILPLDEAPISLESRITLGTREVAHE